jgi:AmmeMemoRadiSam system protein B
MVPILCGPIEPFFKPAEDFSRLDALRRFSAALREELDRSGRRWTIIAGVDWSHVGIKFGDSIPVDERILWRLERMDRRLLTRLENLDDGFFYREIVRRENASRIDGCVAVLTMLEACRGLLSKGRLLHYGRMFERDRGSAVSFAAMAFQ